MKFVLVVLSAAFAAPAFAGTPPPLPEPGILGLVGIGAVAIIITLRNRRK